MEKDYCYEPYKTNSLKRDTVVTSTSKTKKPPKNNNQDSSCNCCCFKKTKKNSSTSSSSASSSKTKAFFTGLATNLGICVLLFGYTLIGSLIFLAIEGGNTFHHLHHSTQILATTSIASDAKNSPSETSSSSSLNYKFLNQSAELKARNDAARTRTVENIWEITVSLNILYRDNWTRLAAQEITRFQDELLKSLGEELALQPLLHQEEATASNRKNKHVVNNENYEWTFAKAFLYSLTVLTTIGYGSIAPRTALGKAVTMGYAMLGIPLTLLYLSSIGSILSRVARGVFSRALCCCLCSNCGYCCYDEKRMAEKERRMKKKRQQLELQQQIALQQEPFYVRSNSMQHNNLHSPIRGEIVSNSKEIDSLSCTDNESKSSSMHGLSILAPILLCLGMMLVYICLGTFALYKLENWAILDGFYFCFMSLTTIGFGNMVPGTDPFINHSSGAESTNTTIWFCSIYIMSGMALTAMCFNVVHDEIVHRLKHQEKIITGGVGAAGALKLNSTSFTMDDLTNSSAGDPYNMTS